MKSLRKEAFFMGIYHPDFRSYVAEFALSIFCISLKNAKDFLSYLTKLK